MAQKLDIETEIQLPDHIDNLFDLSGKVALITTAASGLGRGIAYGMAKYGANVACADLNLSGAEETLPPESKGGGGTPLLFNMMYPIGCKWKTWWSGPPIISGG
jgi:hypothetical protein